MTTKTNIKELVVKNLKEINLKRKIELGAKDVFPGKIYTWPLEEKEAFNKANNKLKEIQKFFYSKCFKDSHIESISQSNKILDEEKAKIIAANIDIKWNLLITSMFNEEVMIKRLELQMPKDYKSDQEKIARLLQYPSDFIKVNACKSNTNAYLASNIIKLSLVRQFIGTGSNYEYAKEMLGPFQKHISPEGFSKYVDEYDKSMLLMFDALEKKTALLSMKIKVYT